MRPAYSIRTEPNESRFIEYVYRNLEHLVILDLIGDDPDSAKIALSGESNGDLPEVAPDEHKFWLSIGYAGEDLEEYGPYWIRNAVYRFNPSRVEYQLTSERQTVASQPREPAQEGVEYEKGSSLDFVLADLAQKAGLTYKSEGDFDKVELTEGYQLERGKPLDGVMRDLAARYNLAIKISGDEVTVISRVEPSEKLSGVNLSLTLVGVLSATLNEVRPNSPDLSHRVLIKWYNDETGEIEADIIGGSGTLINSDDLFEKLPKTKAEAVAIGTRALSAADSSSTAFTVIINGTPTVRPGAIVHTESDWPGVARDRDFLIRRVRHSLSGSGQGFTTEITCRKPKGS